jgi:RimJ/RimL family protein N-acetyltransferase
MDVEETGPGTGAGAESAAAEVVDPRRDQILKLVTKGFFNEMVNYGVRREEMIRVASHLLDNVLKNGTARPGRSTSDATLTIAAVVDRWEAERTLSVQDVTLRPFERGLVPAVLTWLRQPGVNESFATPFPESKRELERYLCAESRHREYLAIHAGGAAVGIIGGEGRDSVSGKVEMRKLVGDPALRGQGIGKRATFAFLYYAFEILGLHKVYIHSRDINVRNINVNSASGFELEGVFLEDLATPDGRRADLIRMALLRSRWRAAFGGPAHEPGSGAPQNGAAQK